VFGASPRHHERCTQDFYIDTIASKEIPVVNNQSGGLTLDFIFALVLVLSMTLLLGVFSFTLSVVEGIQYLTFSSSRAYFAGNLSESAQRDAAQKKFDDLSKTSSYKKLLKIDWFKVSIDKIGDSASTYGAEDPKDIFEGVRVKLDVGLLDLKIPFFGSTKGDKPFQTYITSFLGRESTTEECLSMVKKRYEEILKLGAYRTGSVQPGAYVPFDDNGC
jgi:hypothetical protein